MSTAVTLPSKEPGKILVVQPSWVGDAVMATPTLRALRQLYPNAHISYLVRRYVKPMYTGMPWADQLISYRTTSAHRPSTNLFRLSLRLRRAKFDLAVLLPNSFKTALICKGAGIPRIVGYDRDARTLLLTDRLIPLRSGGRYVPTPIVRTYLALAQHLGSPATDLTLELFVTDPEKRHAEAVLTAAGLPPDIHRPGAAAASTGASGPLVLLNPGAQFGEAKCWPPERFAAVADELVRRHNATILVSGAPRERRILDEVLRNIRTRAIDLSRLTPSPTLGSLKEIIRRCDLMITNDTGPRHIAAAMGVPVITIFGPTHQAWTEIYFEAERKIAIPVDCGPCQKKICPLDHRCMTGITPAHITGQAQDMLQLTLRGQPR